MKSQDLKAEILGWLRYVRKQEIVCTEVGTWKADCWGINDSRIIEVETKVTLADFRADFKKPKHQAYQNLTGYGVPNLFYFAVPIDLEIPALKLLEERAAEKPQLAKYGLLIVTKLDGYLGRQTREAKPAQRIHTAKPAEAIRRVALLRQSSEICGLHQALGATQRLIEPAMTEFASRTRMLYSEVDRAIELAASNYVEKDTDGTT